jgi:Xaa-Pro aminopeptidase
VSIDRVKEAHLLLDKHRCTWILVTDVVDVQYISGFASSRVLLLIGRNSNHLYTDFRYREAAERFCKKNPEWQFTLIEDGGYSFLGSELRRGGSVAVQSDVMTIDEHARLHHAFPKARFIPLRCEISDLALSKNPAEIRCMKIAAGIGDEAFRRFRLRLKPGITEHDAAGFIDTLCAELGSEKPSFDTIVLFGERSSLPHGRPGPRKLKRGDFVLADFGCTVSGLCSDMTRTVVFGGASKRQREIYDLVKKAHDAALAAARSGLPGRALDAIARSIIAQAGYGDSFGHGLGHGVGRRVHERPRVSPLSAEILEEGSVVTIEPGIYLPGFGGVRIEDMTVILKKSSRPLTASPSELIEI